MKTFIEFEYKCKDFIIVDNKNYKEDEFNKLHGLSYNIHIGFDLKNPIISKALFQWNDKDKCLNTYIWLESIDIKYFESNILSGQFVPVDIRLTLDNVNSMDCKNMTRIDLDEYIDKFIVRTR